MSQYVVGMKELWDRLQMLTTLHQRKIVRRAMRQAANDMMADEMRMSPIDTGGIFWSYVVRAMRRQRRGMLGYRVVNRVPPGMKAVMRHYYASFVNYGTKYMSARRFMNKAVEQHGLDNLKTVVQGVKDELNAIGR